MRTVHFPISYLYQYGLMDIYYYSGDYNPMISLFLLLKLLQLWPLELSVWLPCSFKHYPSTFFFFFFKAFCNLAHTKVSQAPSVFSVSVLESTTSPRSGESEIKNWILGLFITAGLSHLLVILSGHN